MAKRTRAISAPANKGTGGGGGGSSVGPEGAIQFSSDGAGGFGGNEQGLIYDSSGKTVIQLGANGGGIGIGGGGYFVVNFNTYSFRFSFDNLSSSYDFQVPPTGGGGSYPYFLINTDGGGTTDWVTVPVLGGLLTSDSSFIGSIQNISGGAGGQSALLSGGFGSAVAMDAGFQAQLAASFGFSSFADFMTAITNLQSMYSEWQNAGSGGAFFNYSGDVSGTLGGNLVVQSGFVSAFTPAS